MTALEDLQHNFRQHLTSGDLRILSSVVSTDSLSNIDRLAIYGHAYYARLIEALADDFEAIHTLLGDDEFARMCRYYIDKYPSKYFTLRWFGQFMADFLRATQPYSSHEYLYEMARFEWMFTDAFDAPDASTVTESEVAQVPADRWPHFRINFHPSVHWFNYSWNILPVWKAAKDQLDVPELKKIDPIETCLIWRQKLTTKYRTLSANEALLINAASEGRNFSQWCELLLASGESGEDVPMIAAGILKTWLGQGMISQIEY